MNNSRKQLRALAVDALMIALYVVLNTISEITIGTLKITFGPLPVLILAFYYIFDYGIMHASIVAFIGEFLAQLIHPIDFLIFIWSIPPIMRGVISSVLFLFIIKRKQYQNITKVNHFEYFVVILISGFVTTWLNTAVMATHALCFGYYSHAYVFGTLIMRFIAMVISSVIYTFIAKAVTDALYKAKV